MDDFLISIVIPTFNRKEVLEKCLRNLCNQDFQRAGYEIIVVDDGSNDGTEILFDKLSKGIDVSLRCMRQKHKGPAAARNLGIKNTKGSIILFLGDDIIADSGLLKEHYSWHVKYPQNNYAVLGHITWSKEIKVSPFMRWLENGGPQFAFGQIKDKEDAGAQGFFYSSNISVKRRFLLSNNAFFDEAFQKAAYEDLELGCRLKKIGLILKYNENALAYHQHYTSLAAACQRMNVVGQYSRLFYEKTAKTPRDFRRPFWREIASRFKFGIFYLRAKYYEHRLIKESIFKYVMEHCFIRGALKAGKIQHLK